MIDPVAAFLDASVNSHNDASVRSALAPLAQLAQETRASIVLLRHLNKTVEVENAMYRGGGSIPFSGLARSVLIVARQSSKSDRLVLAQTKGNLSKGRPASLGWQVVPWEEDERLPRIEWHGVVDVSADELVERKDARRQAPARDHAKEVISLVLADDPLHIVKAKQSASEAGVSGKTFDAAASDLGAHRYPVHEVGQSKRIVEWRIHLPHTGCPPECHLLDFEPDNDSP